MAGDEGRGIRRVIERLSEAQCMELINSATVGRLVYTSRYGPVALPFEYKVHEGSIVFRTYRAVFTEEDLRTDIPHAEYGIVVEIDETDTETHEGWIVIVQGPAHHVDSDAERSKIADIGLESWIEGEPEHFIHDIGLESWIEGEPEHFIRVTPTTVAGQRLRPA